MAARSHKTRSASKGDARLYVGKAREFLEIAQTALVGEQWDTAGLSAIHSGISAADAVCSYHGGVRSAGQDHRVAADLLVTTMGESSRDAARHLQRLVAKKNLVEYEQRRLIQSEAEDLVHHARRFLVWAEMQLPS